MRICTIDGCEEKARARSLCTTHYHYERRTGKRWTPDVGRRVPIQDRFWTKVDPADPDECWEWQGAICRQTGYGSIGKGGHGNGSVGAHRVSYELHHGPIPKGAVVMHTCDNRACVNPSHLKLGTHKDNTRDMMRKGRHRFQAPRGEKSSLSKLTASAVRFIRQHQEISATELAEAFGVGHCAIWRIRTGKTWSHIS